MEAALGGVKTISLSYAYESRVHNPAHISMASKIGAQLCKYLYENWDPRVQVYTVNIPLLDSLSEHTKIIYTDILENSWTSVFVPWDEYALRKAHGEYEDESHVDLATDSSLRDENRVQFKWKPDFAAAEKTFQASRPGTDAWALNHGMIR
jgi:5'/3'-nucleotidase SurE